MKTTFKQYLQEAKVRMPKAESLHDLLNSIDENGYFTKDGRNLDFGYPESKYLNLRKLGLKSLVGSPGWVDGFDCSSNELKSLEGSPFDINGEFVCSHNVLESLEGAPLEINGKFDCCFNNLTSLVGGPKTIKEEFDCHGNKLTSLEGAPKTIAGTFWCSGNKLKSLIGAPNIIESYFLCGNNNLLSLEGAPQKVGEDFDCYENHLTSLESIHMHIHEIGGNADFRDNPIKSHVLGLLKIKGLKSVSLDNQKVAAIINKYLGKNPSLRDIVDCQEELMDNDLEDYALL